MDHQCDNSKAAVIDGEYVSGCPQCLSSTGKYSDFSRKFQRTAMKQKHRADMVQRYDGGKINPEWVKLYTDRAIRDLGQEKVTEILRGR